jgi:hypothetical protein
MLEGAPLLLLLVDDDTRGIDLWWEYYWPSLVVIDSGLGNRGIIGCHSRRSYVPITIAIHLIARHCAPFVNVTQLDCEVVVCPFPTMERFVLLQTFLILCLLRRSQHTPALNKTAVPRILTKTAIYRRSWRRLSMEKSSVRQHIINPRHGGFLAGVSLR